MAGESISTQTAVEATPAASGRAGEQRHRRRPRRVRSACGRHAERRRGRKSRRERIHLHGWFTLPWQPGIDPPSYAARERGEY